MIAMYIFVNTDLKMSAGKIASQVGHVVHKIVDELVRSGYEEFPIPYDFVLYRRWCDNCTKIVLKANTQEIDELSAHAKARTFIDSGNTTQGTDNCTTVVGFFPGTEIDVSNYKLL